MFVGLPRGHLDAVLCGMRTMLKGSEDDLDRRDVIGRTMWNKSLQ